MSIITKVYVVSFDDDKFIETQIDFSETSLKLVKWNPFATKKLTNKYIDKNATTMCKYFCSDKMIKTWIAHVSLWKHILKNKETHVLIISDEVTPVSNFDNKLKMMWQEIPKNWDIVYFGCAGTCDLTSFATEFLTLTSGKQNQNIYRDKKLMEHIIRPAVPIGLYGYMVSYKGVQKLLKDEYFKKISMTADYTLPTHVLNDSSFNIFAFIPPLITKYIDPLAKDNGEELETHKLLKPILSQVPVGKGISLQEFSNYELADWRQIDTKLTYFSLILLIISFIFGLTGNQNIVKYYFITIIFYQMFELAYTKTNKTIAKSIILETGIALTFLALGYKTRNYLKEK